MVKPKVTAIITSYNRFDYLQNAIQSVVNQDYENLEIIVVNDDSDDQRYYEYEFPEIVKLIHIDRKETPNWGGSRQPLRNIAANMSDAKYLAFLDDDDIWLKNKLNIQIDALEKSDCKLSSTEGYYGEGVYQDGQEFEVVLPSIIDPKLMDTLFEYSVIVEGRRVPPPSLFRQLLVAKSVVGNSK